MKRRGIKDRIRYAHRHTISLAPKSQQRLRNFVFWARSQSGPNEIKLDDVLKREFLEIADAFEKILSGADPKKALGINFKRGTKEADEEKTVIAESVVFYMQSMTYENAVWEVHQITTRSRRFIKEAYKRHKFMASIQLQENLKKDPTYHPLFIVLDI